MRANVLAGLKIRTLGHVSLGNGAVMVGGEACHSEYYDPADPEVDAIYLLELDEIELRSPAEGGTALTSRPQ